MPNEISIEPHSPLISASNLTAVMSQPNTKIFDVRGTWSSPARALPDDFTAGHIPGAVFLDWTRLFLEPDLPVDLAPVASIEQAAFAFQSLGINQHDLVVLYDDYHHMLAGRIWWAMRYWGFENVKVLNGGWHYWCAENHRITDKLVIPASGNFSPVKQGDHRISMDEFLNLKESSCVLDGRGRSGYTGTDSDERSGHIPGAINIPYQLALDQTTGLFLDPAALSSLFDQRCPDWRDRKIISSCGAGYSGTVLMLAMAHLGVASSLFDDSFSVWKQDPSRPIERGDPLHNSH